MPTAKWTLLSKLPSKARSSHALTSTPSGRLLLHGGELFPRTPVDTTAPGSLHAYHLKQALNDKANAKWTTLSPSPSPGPVPEPRVGATTVWDPATESLYLWGGRGGVDMAPLGSPQVGLWKGRLTADDSTVAWERLEAANEGDAPEPRSYHSAVSAPGTIYIHAGCPASGRLATLHAFDLASRTWSTLAPAPGPPRGGTSLALTALHPASPPVLIRFGGFAGDELGADGALDIYTPASNTWRTLLPAPDPDSTHRPGARSVGGLVPFTSRSPALAACIALLYHGERAPTPPGVGHSGAGEFWDDVWLLERRGGGGDAGESGLAWRRVQVEGGPEARGWFPSAWYEENGETRVVLFGGLLGSNARSDELWVLQVE